MDHIAVTTDSKYSKTCLKRPLEEDQKLLFKTAYRLMQVKSIAECSKGSILQYFRPSLSHHLPVRSLFCLFLCGRLRQVLLYVKDGITKWIRDWKQNDWKTARRKGDKDVLNKDLWLILDFLQEQLNVNWYCVEGHKDNQGNKEADELAKVGISADSTFWQHRAFNWYEKQCLSGVNIS